MCGIVGYIGDQNAANVLVEGLRRLEYRGYDSAGIAVMNNVGVAVRRSVGKLAALEELLKQKPIQGTIGLGHTRWATHGRPREENAHPHSCCHGKTMVIHNGIIENYIELKSQLMAKGHAFKSETDTEVIAHLVEEAFRGNLLEAVFEALRHIKGSYAIGVMSADDPGRFVAARKDSPLVLGIGEKETLIASDVPAILPYTRKVIFLEDGEVAELTQKKVRLFNAQGTVIVREPQLIEWDAKLAEKDGFKHFMLKEILEQRLTIPQTYRSRISAEKDRILLQDVLPERIPQGISRICLVGCGTSYHAALVSRFWFEEIARIPCSVEIASEHRYRRSEESRGTLVVAITQSGETADTLAALRDSKAKGLTTVALCNAMGSTATRDAAHTLYTYCGPEIGVASTKAFTGQLTALFLLALYIGQCRNAIAMPLLHSLIEDLSQLPHALEAIFEQSQTIEKIARRFYNASHFLYLGRHLNYPIALEGALKLKEISYIHAEGYPAGEMKHGPIALIDEGLPVVVIATKSCVREKVLGNIEEIKARGGVVLAVGTEGDEEVMKKADYFLPIPSVNEAVAPLLSIIPLQLFAYYMAVLRGSDVDQPRNLAKSVTVE